MRFLLALYGHAAWEYGAFLDFCAERVLLCKAGGGYMFVRRMLMEYFAGLEGEYGAARSNPE